MGRTVPFSFFGHAGIREMLRFLRSRWSVEMTAMGWRCPATGVFGNNGMYCLFLLCTCKNPAPSCEASREICYYASISLLVKTFELS